MCMRTQISERPYSRSDALMHSSDICVRAFAVGFYGDQFFSSVRRRYGDGRRIGTLSTALTAAIQQAVEGSQSSEGQPAVTARSPVPDEPSGIGGARTPR